MIDKPQEIFKKYLKLQDTHYIIDSEKVYYYALLYFRQPKNYAEAMNLFNK